MGTHGRRRAVAIGALALVVVLIVVLAQGGGASAPRDSTARLVPDTALAYVHLDTDTSSDQVRAALVLAKKFPSYRRVRDSVVARLTGSGCGVSSKDMGGGEAAVAVVGGGALVLIDTGHDHRDAAARPCGRVSAQYAGRFLAIGPASVLSQVQDLRRGRGRSLAADPAFRRARNGLPAGRFADGYLTAGALRGLLAPQGGLVGVAGVLLDRPGLTGMGFALEARSPGARLTVRELIDSKRAPATFRPSLLSHIPAGSLAALDVRDLGSAVRRLGGLISGLGSTEQRRIAAALHGETALWLTPSVPAPRLTLLSAAGSTRPDALPHTFAGASLYSAVLGPDLVASTDVSGIAAARRGPGARLTDSSIYRSVLSGVPSRVTSLTFLDFSELLRLAEQTGLSNSRAYQRIRDDLRRVRAVGATSTGVAGETTLQVELSIP